MRFSILAMVLLAPLAAFAQAPDPAPSTPVQTVDLAPFEPTREDAILEAYIDGVVSAHMREHDTPGAIVSVVKDGRTLFAKGYGYADIEKGVRADGDTTLFRIGSVSKTFVWTAVMMLHERGRIDLDADVNRYLKDLKIPDKFGAPITMNDLMAHRAGFEDTLGVFTHRDDAALSLTEALKEDMPKRVFPPGARTSYSNWGAALAAKIVEDVSGVSYEQFLEREILAPLGMIKTTLKGPGAMPAGLRKALATGYKYKNGAPTPVDYMQIGPYAPTGSVAATADDMARWMAFLLSDDENPGLLSNQSRRLMHKRFFTDRPDGADIAHGLIAKTYRGYETFGHGGATEAFFTNMVLVPKLDIGIFISQNATEDRTLVTELPDLVIDRLANVSLATSLSASAGDQSSNLKEYAGIYLHNRRSFSRFEKLFAANAIAKVAASEDSALIVTAQGKAIRYEPVAGATDTFENRYGERIAFGRDEKGVVTHLSDWSGVHSLDKPGVFDNPVLLNVALGAAFLFSLTTLAGAWRRQGRSVTPNAYGMLLDFGDLIAAAIFFGLLGAVIWATVVLSSASAADLLNYPPAAIRVLQLTAYAFFAASIAMVAGLWQAWALTEWGVLRKIHHTLFAFALIFLAFLLVQWKVIFSATV